MRTALTAAVQWRCSTLSSMASSTLHTSACALNLDANLGAWETKARREAKGHDPATAFGHKTDDVGAGDCLVTLCVLYLACTHAHRVSSSSLSTVRKTLPTTPAQTRCPHHHLLHIAHMIAAYKLYCDDYLAHVIQLPRDQHHFLAL